MKEAGGRLIGAAALVAMLSTIPFATGPSTAEAHLDPVCLNIIHLNPGLPAICNLNPPHVKLVLDGYTTFEREERGRICTWRRYKFLKYTREDHGAWTHTHNVYRSYRWYCINRDGTVNLSVP